MELHVAAQNNGILCLMCCSTALSSEQSRIHDRDDCCSYKEILSTPFPDPTIKRRFPEHTPGACLVQGTDRFRASQQFIQCCALIKICCEKSSLLTDPESISHSGPVKKFFCPIQNLILGQQLGEPFPITRKTIPLCNLWPYPFSAWHAKAA